MTGTFLVKKGDYYRPLKNKTVNVVRIRVSFHDGYGCDTLSEVRVYDEDGNSFVLEDYKNMYTLRMI